MTVETAAAAAVDAGRAMPHGRFVDDDGQTWYRLDGIEHQAPFFVALASDSDVWAFVSTAGSLAAGRRDAEGSFFPYETVDRIHRRWEHTGPRTWIRLAGRDGKTELWQPFAPRLDGGAGARSVWKNLSGTRLRFQETHPDGRLTFQVEWSSAAALGLVRQARLWAHGEPQPVQVLDGVLDFVPPGVSVAHATTMSCLADAYKWNESAAGGQLGIYTLYAQIWDRAEPKESFRALVAWHAGLPPQARTLLCDDQVRAFCETGAVQAETVTRGRRGAFLVQFSATVSAEGLAWQQVIDAPLSQVQVADLARRLEAGITPHDIRAAVDANTRGLDELLARADAFQTSADAMAAAHHRANVLYNIMRGGVFADGTMLERDDLRAWLAARHRPTALALAATVDGWPERVTREQALRDARAAGGEAAERLVLGYLPLTFSRRHGDPSRPWNRFSIRVRDAAGRRVLHHEGNWRDIFQNWEALLPSEPAYAGSMIEAFLGAMTPDGYNPYRIGRNGVDWEVVEPENPWSFIGYWGDHQVIYLLRLLEAAQARDPALLPALWNRALFSFADVPYRLKPHAQQIAQPKATIVFDEAAHARALARAQRVGSDGRMVCDAHDAPVLATLGEKLATIVLAKAGSLVPGGGLWLHTQRPEWNDANNALVGQGLSVVTLASLRRMLNFIVALPVAQQAFALPQALLDALQGFVQILRASPDAACDDAQARRAFMDQVGGLLDTWRAQAYRGADGRAMTVAPAGWLPAVAHALLPWIDATLQRCRRDDGLFHSYNLVDFSAPGRAELGTLYPMLEGQVALLSSGALSLREAVALLDALFASPLFDARRRSFVLYPDRHLPGFLERNRLDAQALALPVVQRLLAADRHDVLQRQGDGTVRFAPGIANRADLQAAAADLSDAGDDLPVLVAAYERLLNHHAFTGRSGTMFAYEGLGCIYWHMVAKLLLAVQERVFEASDGQAPELPALKAHYLRVRDGLGYRQSAAAFGAFPADPYSHTPALGGAQQPGMTGQVKEEILTRWGELGLRFERGHIRFDPVLLDRAEIPAGGALSFTLARVPYRIQRGAQTRVRVRAGTTWRDAPGLAFEPAGIDEVEIELA